MFDMMRQNFKLDHEIGASSSAAEINNNIAETSQSQSPIEEQPKIRKLLNEIKNSNSEDNKAKQASLFSYFERVKQQTLEEKANASSLIDSEN